MEGKPDDMAKATWDLKRQIDDMLLAKANPVAPKNDFRGDASDEPLSQFRIEDF